MDLTPHVHGPTHCSGHTSDVFIDRQNDQMLSDFKTVPGMPSDHYAVRYSIAYLKPKLTKKIVKQRQLKKIDMKAFNDNIMNAFFYSETRRTSIDVISLTDNYNQILRDFSDKHTPECIRSITLCPNAPWFNDSLRAMKKQRRRYERRYLSTRLEVHRLIYTEKFNTAKTVYYKSLLSNSDEKQLFQVIHGLFKVKPVPVLPTHTSLQSFTEPFNNFFTKIQKLMYDLQNNNLEMQNMSVTIDQPPCKFALSEFATMSEASIKDIILR